MNVSLLTILARWQSALVPLIISSISCPISGAFDCWRRVVVPVRGSYLGGDMAIEVWDAEELAGILLGIDDAKADLKELFTRKQEGTQPDNYVVEITEAAERWDDLVDQMERWPLVRNGPHDS